MKRPASESVLLLPPDIEKLEGFVKPLNTEFFGLVMPNLPLDGRWKVIKKDYRPVQQELRRLVQAWRDSGPNVSKLFEADPILAEAAGHFRAMMIPTTGPTARLLYLTVPEDMDPIAPHTLPLSLFLDFLLNPFNTRLGGPCARCGRYFIRKNLRHKIYCSQRCGLRHTAMAVNRKRRAAEHGEKLHRARESAARWAKSRTRTDWKDWVSRDTTISKNWLTRAARNAELVVPTKQIH